LAQNNYNQTSAENCTDETPLSNEDSQENLTSLHAPQQFNAQYHQENQEEQMSQIRHQIEYTEVFVWGDHRQG